MGLITELEPSFCAILGSCAGSVLVNKICIEIECSFVWKRCMLGT